MLWLPNTLYALRRLSLHTFSASHDSWRHNGLEFCNRAMLTWAHERGITLRLIAPGNPRTVQTSVVKKSAAIRAGQCARRNVRQIIGRSRLGGMPSAFRMLAIVDRATRWPTFFSAP